MRKVLLTAFAAALLSLAAAGAAQADGVAITEFSVQPSDTQAGGHSDLQLVWEMQNHFKPALGEACDCNDAKDIVIDVPAGVVGNPHAYPRCTAKEFGLNECAIDSQIGVVESTGCVSPDFCVGFPVPLYNLEPGPNQAGLLGFKTFFIATPVYNEITARTSDDYGLRTITRGLERVLPISKVEYTLWGVPAHPSHDAARALEVPPAPSFPVFGAPSNSPERPFLQNPVVCRNNSLASTIDILAYDGGRTNASAPWPEMTGCGLTGFNPSLAAKPTTSAADTPSGLDIDLTVPQSQSPATPASSQIKATTVTLPVGFSINPNAADGKTSCTDAEARFGTLDAAQCPEHSKIGTLEVHSAVLPGVLPGAMYLGQPLPGERYRIFLVADGFGIHVKLPGTTFADPRTGQVTVSFQNLPQTPFEEFNMHVFGSERGLLATPTECGTYAVESRFTPWNSDLSDQTSTQFFQIDKGPGGSPCPGASRPFDPAFKAASAGNAAGGYAPFQVQVDRGDGDQNLVGLSVTTAPGFSGKLAGIPYCPEPALASLSDPLRTGLVEVAASACPVESQIGRAVVAAGAGSAPIVSDGKVYLAGPYRGAPISLIVVIPAISGPYDLGNVAVRAAIHVDPVTARVTTVSDPFPHILEGIPLRARSVQVLLDRPGFALNPTDCSPFSTEASILGDDGGRAQRSSHFQVANCANLGFAPKLALRLTGAHGRTGHPALRATLTARPGDANISRAVVRLPGSLQIDQGNIDTVCTRVQFAAEACPAGSRLGSVQATTPLLDEPLRGPVYLRSSNNKLPDLVADLEGQIDVVLDARIDTVKTGLRTSFDNVPDVPVTRFVLFVEGRDSGLLVNNRDLCRGRQVASVRMTGQNAKRLNRRVKLKTPCGGRR